MMTAEEAKEKTNTYLDSILTAEGLILLKRIYDAIDECCRAGLYNCLVSYDIFHSAVGENVRIQLEEAGYKVRNNVYSSELLISWE